jgi:hypothetical protein
VVRIYFLKKDFFVSVGASRWVASISTRAGTALQMQN